MNARVGPIVAIIIQALLFCSALPGFAIEHTYVEDFTTTRYKDAVNTTALWDTAARQLKLAPFWAGIVGYGGTAGGACGVAVDGDLAFVADEHFGLFVIDIKNPGLPVSVGSCATPGGAQSVTVAGDLAFVADYNSGLQVIDISNPAAPAIVGSYATTGVARVAVAGDHAFLAAMTTGLVVVDISNPTSPALAGTCNTPGTAYDVVVDGDLAFVADGGAGLQVVDISDLAHPAIVGTRPAYSIAYGVDVDGDLVYVADAGSGLLVIDVADPANPVTLGFQDTGNIAFRVSVEGDVAYVTDLYAGLNIIDVSDPASPWLMDIVALPSTTREAVVSGCHAYVAAYTSGLWAVEIAKPYSQPVLVGGVDTAYQPAAIAVAGDYCYVADGQNGDLLVMDISDPTHPAIAGSYNTYFCYGIAVAGDHAFLGHRDNGLTVLDISDPTHPAVVGSLNPAQLCFKVVLSGNHAFVACSSAGLLVVDISDPVNPTIAATLDELTSVREIAVAGEHLYVANYDAGLSVIDISDPASPVEVGGYDSPELDAAGIAVAGNHAFLANSSGGLTVLDITDPTNPVLAGNCQMEGMSSAVAIAGDRAYLTDVYGFLHVIDIGDPTHPVLLGSTPTPDSCQPIVIAGDYAYLGAHAAGGLQVAKLRSRNFHVEANAGRSLALDATDRNIARVRLTAAQVDSIRWEVSATGGAAWEDIPPDGAWHEMTALGVDLLWRSSHFSPHDDVNPACGSLTVDWRYQCAMIDSIVDVPADQGGLVRIHFLNSGYDLADEVETPVITYGVWQRVDDKALLNELRSLDPSAAVVAEDLSSLRLLNWRDTRFCLDGGWAKGEAFPPGVWELVTTVPALQADQYIVRTTTVADSAAAGNVWSVYCVTAHTVTPTAWYASPPDSGYSIDNIAPAVPEDLRRELDGTLAWDASPDADFHYFTVYGSAVDHLDGSETLIDRTIGTSLDIGGLAHAYFLVTATDCHGNESAAAALDAVTDVPDAQPTRYALHQCAPNPFNPATSIRFDLPQASRVSLRVYDMVGRLVQTLVDGELMAAGRREAVWRGCDDSGRQLGAGVYFCRLEAGPFRETRRMTLVK